MKTSSLRIRWILFPPWLSLLVLFANTQITGPSENVSTTTQSTTSDETTTSLPNSSSTTVPIPSTTLFPVSTTAAPRCPDGWTEQSERCYNLTRGPVLSWHDARETCRQWPGGDLLVLNDTQEQSFIIDEVSFQKFGSPDDHLWIGLHRDCPTGNFTWVDGVDLTPELITWELSQPDNFFINECCVDVLAGNRKVSGIYRDRQCSDQQGYICEVPLVPPVVLAPSPSSQRPLATSTAMTSSPFWLVSSALVLTSSAQLYTPSPSYPEPTSTFSQFSLSSLVPTPTLQASTSPGLSVQTSSPPEHSVGLEDATPRQLSSHSLVGGSPSDSSFSYSSSSTIAALASGTVLRSAFFTPILSSAVFREVYAEATSQINLVSRSMGFYEASTVSKPIDYHPTQSLEEYFPEASGEVSLVSPSLEAYSSTMYVMNSQENTQTTQESARSGPSEITQTSHLPHEASTETHSAKSLVTEPASQPGTSTNHHDVSTSTSTSQPPPVTSDQSERAGYGTSPATATTPTPTACRAEILDGLWWTETRHGNSSQQPCPGNPFATVTRDCELVYTSVAAWRQPDYTDCNVPTAGELLERLTFMSHFPEVDPSDAIKSTFQLSQLLAPPTSDQGNDARATAADGYPVRVELLEMAAALPSKFAECRQAEMQDFANSFLQAVDNILHPNNIAIWAANKEVSADTVRIMDAVESFTAQTTRDTCDLRLTSLDSTQAFFEGRYDHIVFRKSRETAATFAGLTFKASSPAASISLPPELFEGVTDEQVTLLVVLYPTIGQLLDSVTTIDGASSEITKKVMSSVVTSSTVHQSDDAFQKLSVPLCINFTKRVSTFEKDENCVYLGRTQSGESQWLTDGCWMNQQRNGSVHCCCNHMTSFALLSATQETKPFQLLLLTYVLCSASCFVICLSALILLSVRHLHTASLTVHTSLAFSMVLSFVAVMAGLERTSNQVACKILAIATHYLMTSQFFWSLEGALLVGSLASSDHMERRVFRPWIYHVIGWCGPLLPVGICLALMFEGYGGAERCWFSNDVLVGLITSLGLPGLVNVLVLVYISGKNVPTGTSMHNVGRDGHAAKQQAMDGMRSNLVVLLLLCVCWGFGIAAFQLQDEFLQQAFAVSSLLLGLCFFMMHLVLSQDVRNAIMDGRKKSRKRRQNRMKLRKSIDSLVAGSSSPDEATNAAEPRHHTIHVQPSFNRHDHSLGSTSTSLSQHNSHSIGTNCTELASDPIHEEVYSPYRRSIRGLPEPLGVDHQALPWINLGMLSAEHGSSYGNTTPQRHRGDSKERKEPSPRMRNGNIILNHKIIKDSDEGRTTEEDSPDRTQRGKQHLSSISGSRRSLEASRKSLQMDWGNRRGSRVHPMPLHEDHTDLDYNQSLYQSLVFHPRVTGFLTHPHGALEAAPSSSLGRRQDMPEIREVYNGRHGSIVRSLGNTPNHHGDERRSLRGSFYGARQLATRMDSQIPHGEYSSNMGYHGHQAFDAGLHMPGTSGYNPKEHEGAHIRKRSRSFGSDDRRSEERDRSTLSREKSQSSGHRRSKSRGGKKHRHKSSSKTRTKEV